MNKVRALVEDEGNPSSNYVSTSLAVVFASNTDFLEETVSEDDTIIERDGVTALIDA